MESDLLRGPAPLIELAFVSTESFPLAAQKVCFASKSPLRGNACFQAGDLPMPPCGDSLGSNLSVGWQKGSCCWLLVSATDLDDWSAWKETEHDRT